ncbi:MAG: hypothetical protein WCZ87_06700 [Thiohalobacteraceae bacterium]
MQSHTNHRPFASVLVALGVALSFASAVVPHYTAGYTLMMGVLLSGLLPYLVYGIAIPFLQGWVLSLPGVVLVLLHAALVARERFLDHADYGNGLIYLVPLVLAVALLPVVYLALKRPWGAEPPPKQPVSPATGT